MLDTGSTGGLISQDLVEIYGFETQNNDSTWDTNAGLFKTGKTTFAKKLRFPQFTDKRVINIAKMYINPNHDQKYKMIFGLDFLIANKFDFCGSMRQVCGEAWRLIYIITISRRKEKNAGLSTNICRITSMKGILEQQLPHTRTHRT